MLTEIFEGDCIDHSLFDSKGKTNVVNIKKVKGNFVYCSKYVGRRVTMGGRDLPDTKWGNPFKVRDNSNDGIIKYINYVYDSGLIDEIEELRGHTLGCWCVPKMCHATILKTILDLTDMSFNIVLQPSSEDVISHLKLK